MKNYIIAAMLVGSVPTYANAQCDVLVGNILTKHLAPAIADLDCPTSAIDKKDHKLVGICYQSTGPTSHIRIDTSLRCHASCESVTSKLTGCDSAGSLSENVTAEATVQGSDCSIVDISVSPSGELGKLLAKWFDVEGKARDALQKGLADACSQKK